MKTQKRKANLRSAISILCAVTMVLTMFSGLSLTTLAATTLENGNFYDTFDDEALSTDDWTTGSGITSSDVGAGEMDADDSAVTLLGTSLQENIGKNALMRTTASPDGTRILEVEFAGHYATDVDYDGNGTAGNNCDKIRDWGTGLVINGATDSEGNLIGGYVVLVQFTGIWYASTGNTVEVYKVNEDGTLGDTLQTTDITSITGICNKKFKLRCTVSNDDEGTTIDWEFYVAGTKRASDTYTDSSDAVASGKSGVTVSSTWNSGCGISHTNYTAVDYTIPPLVDIYSFSDEEKPVACDKIDTFDSYIAEDWTTGSGISSSDVVTAEIDTTDSAVALLGTSLQDYIGKNALMRTSASPEGTRLLEVEFSGHYATDKNYDNYGTVNEDCDKIRNWGTGLVINGATDDNGDLIGGYIVLMRTDNVWYSLICQTVYVYKVNSDGTATQVESKDINLSGVWDKKFKLQCTVSEDDKTGITIDWNFYVAGTKKASGSYIDADATYTSGKSGVTIVSTWNNECSHKTGNYTIPPYVDIYSFKDETVLDPCDKIDTFDSLTEEDWSFGTGIGKHNGQASPTIGAGCKFSSDNAIKLLGDTTLAAASKNVMMRTATGDESTRLLEVEFAGEYTYYYDYDTSVVGSSNGDMIKDWGVGIVINGSTDVYGNLYDGYIVMARPVSGVYHSASGDKIYIYKVSAGSLTQVATQSMSDLGNKWNCKFKLQCTVSTDDSGTTIGWKLYESGTQKYNGEYTDDTGAAYTSGKSGVSIISTSGIPPYVDIYSFRDEVVPDPCDKKDTFDSLKNDDWAFGSGIAAYSVGAGDKFSTDNSIKLLGAINSSGTNVMMRTAASSESTRLLEVEFAGDYSADYNLNSSAGNEHIYGWSAGLVINGSTDVYGNLTGGYIVLVKAATDAEWYSATAHNVIVYKVSSDGGLSSLQSTEIKDLNNIWQDKSKLQCTVTTDSEGTTISWKYYLNGTQKYADSYTDSTETAYTSGKSGISVNSSQKCKPLVDIYSFRDETVLDPCDKIDTFDSLIEEDWSFGTGIGKHNGQESPTIGAGYKFSSDNAIKLLGDTTLAAASKNVMMRTAASPEGTRLLEVEFAGEYTLYHDYNGSGELDDGGDFLKNWGAGLVINGSTDVYGNLMDGYIVMARPVSGTYFQSNGDKIYIYKVSAGSLTEVATQSMSDLGCKWDHKFKLQCTVSTDDSGTTIGWILYDNGTQIYNGEYTDDTGAAYTSGKSGVSIISTSDIPPYVDIYSFRDTQPDGIVNVPGEAEDYSDDFSELSSEQWVLNSNLTTTITDGTIDTNDKVVKITGVTGSDGLIKNVLLRTNASPDGGRFTETEFTGDFTAYDGESSIIKGWSVGVVANAVIDTNGNLMSGYMVVAKMCGDSTWYSGAVNVQCYEIVDGVANKIGDSVDISALGHTKGTLFKLQLSLVPSDTETTLKWALLKKNSEGNWIKDYTSSCTTDSAVVKNGRSGITVMSTSANAPIVDFYSFRDVTPTAPVIATEALDDVLMHEEYSQTIALTEEIPQSVSYSITSGSLPVGLFFDELTGVISGIPLIDREVSVTVKVEDDFGNTDEKVYVFNVTTTDELVYIEIRKNIIGITDERFVNTYRIVDKHIDGEGLIDIRDMVSLKKAMQAE